MSRENVTDPWWTRHPRWAVVVAILLGALGMGGALAVLDYLHRRRERNAYGIGN